MKYLGKVKKSTVILILLIFSFGTFIVCAQEADSEITAGNINQNSQETVTAISDTEEAYDETIENEYTGSPITKEEAADFLQERDLLKGDVNGNLMLDKNLTREEMMVIMSRLLGVEEEAKGYQVDNMTFQDVPRTGQYQHYIAWALEKKITKGKNVELFGFKDPLTGWQTEAFFVRALGYTYVPDENIVMNAEKLGLLAGAELDESQTVTRGTMALIMYNALYAKSSDGLVLGEKLGVIGVNSAQKLVKGNTTGNIINNGLYASDGDRVYFSNIEDGNKLYKMKQDGTEKTKLADDSCLYINVIDDWIYYQNNSDGSKIYKINTNDNTKMKLNEDISGSVFVQGNWIYYTKGGAGQLAKMKTDGSKQQVISDDSCGFINVVGDNIYYVNYDDNNNIYKVRADGKNRVRINDNYSYFLNLAGEWIYYSNQNDGMKLYKVKNDGSDNMKVSDEMSVYINISGEWLYYSNGADDFKPYKMKLDSTNKTKISDEQVSNINIIEGMVFYEIQESENQ